MGLVPTFSQAEIRKRIDNAIAVIERKQIERMQELGERCAIIAKEIPASSGYTDQTKNLRSSTGYMVFKDGVAVHEGYKGEAEGIAAGKALAEKVGYKHNKGVALVVTAGMNYAVHLETMGRDVLTSAEIFAKQEMPKVIERLKNNIKNAI